MPACLVLALYAFLFQNDRMDFNAATVMTEQNMLILNGAAHRHAACGDVGNDLGVGQIDDTQVIQFQ